MICQRMIVAHSHGGYRACADTAVTHREVNGVLNIVADARGAPDLRYRVPLCRLCAKEWDDNGAA